MSLKFSVKKGELNKKFMTQYNCPPEEAMIGDSIIPYIKFFRKHSFSLYSWVFSSPEKSSLKFNTYWQSDRFKPSFGFSDKLIRIRVYFTEITWRVNNLEYGIVQCINSCQQIDFKYSNCIYVHQGIWTSCFFNIIELISFYMYV